MGKRRRGEDEGMWVGGEVERRRQGEEKEMRRGRRTKMIMRR